MKSMPDRNFSAEESLHLIQSMINKAKQDASGRTFYFLLWGWAAFIACAVQFVLKVYFEYRHHYLVWLIIIPCILLHFFHASNDKKRSRVKTYVNSSMEYLWAGMGISFFVLCILFAKSDWFNCYPIFIMMYGLGAFISGKFLQFSPLVVGGMVCWCLAVAAVWFSFDYQPLFAAAALLFSHIIPGHLLRKAHAESSSTDV